MRFPIYCSFIWECVHCKNVSVPFRSSLNLCKAFVLQTLSLFCHPVAAIGFFFSVRKLCDNWSFLSCISKVLLFFFSLYIRHFYFMLMLSKVLGQFPLSFQRYFQFKYCFTKSITAFVPPLICDDICCNLCFLCFLCLLL